MIEQSYFNLLVTDMKYIPTQNVDVKIVSKNALETYHYSTDINGRVSWCVITYHKIYSSYEIWYTPHEVTVTHMGATKSTQLWLDKSYFYHEPFVITLNHKPSISNVTITPAKPKINDLLTVKIEGWFDLDNDSIHYIYRWQRWHGDAWHYIEFEYNATLLLDDDRFAKHDVIRAVVIPFDGFEEGELKYSSQVEIQNSAPSITSIHIEPSQPKEGDMIKVIVEGFDPDGDEIYYMYRWYKNEKIIESALSNTLTSDLFEKNDTIYCVVTPYDSENMVGEAKITGCVIVENTIPVLFDASVFSLENNTFLFTVRYMDADNDAPVLINLILDNKLYKLTNLSDTTNYTDGVLFGIKISLQEGEHIYKFIASDDSGILINTSEEILIAPSIKPVIPPKKGIDWFPLIIMAVIFLTGVFVAWLVFTREMIFNLRARVELETKLQREMALEKEKIEAERALMETEEKIAELIVKEEKKAEELKEELEEIEKELKSRKGGEEEFPFEE
jgi:hypothetical protein